MTPQFGDAQTSGGESTILTYSEFFRVHMSQSNSSADDHAPRSPVNPA